MVNVLRWTLASIIFWSLFFLWVYLPKTVYLFSFFGSLYLMLIFSWLVSDILQAQCRLSIDLSNEAVLITGCDSGFGFETALRLNATGFRVYAGCLFQDREGAKLLKERAMHPNSMVIVPLDVTKNDDIEKAYESISEDLEKSGSKLWAVVNNAGVARTGPTEWGSYEENFEVVINVNQVGAIKVTRKFLPLIRKSRGRVIVISSLCARVYWGYIPAYATSKAAMTGFAGALRTEMRKFGVQVITIEPNFATTPMTTIDYYKTTADKIMFGTPKQIVKDYGNFTINQMEKFYHSTHSKMSEGNFERVIETIFDAVGQKFVNDSYLVSPSNIYYFLYALTMLPDEVIYAILVIFSLLPQECSICADYKQNLLNSRKKLLES